MFGDERAERWLDQGMGECVLKDAKFAAEVAASLHFFDNQRYELGCFVVMPNHVHVVVKPLDSEFSLEEIIGSWKKHSARKINAALGRSGELWQEEANDRIIRDEEHLWRVIQYIGGNPRQAGISGCPVWIRPSWVELGWKFESLIETK